MPIPTLDTDRLILRAFTLADAPTVQRLAGAWEVYDPTLHIPHPYELHMAEGWIKSHASQFEKGTDVVFAITLRASSDLIGAINIRPLPSMRRAELGYWIGHPYWNHGYMSEAANAVLRYGFEELNLNRIHAQHFARNPASGRVMQKIGMTQEGILRQHVRKDDHFEDSVIYGILRSEWQAISNKP